MNACLRKYWEYWVNYNQSSATCFSSQAELCIISIKIMFSNFEPLFTMKSIVKGYLSPSQEHDISFVMIEACVGLVIVEVANDGSPITKSFALPGYNLSSLTRSQLFLTASFKPNKSSPEFTNV